MERDVVDGCLKDNHIKRKPDWLRIKLPSVTEYSYLKNYLNKYNLHTICESGNCPNQGECWGAKTATFMILGDVCTRSCRFCNVKTGVPSKVDDKEPERIAQVIKSMQLKHCVLTSVTRDDLKDGGASIWAETIKATQKLNPFTTIEALVPDFQGKWEHLQQIIDARPNIISHNLETVKRLTNKIRVHAKYEVSLELLKRLSEKGIRSKSGIMVGLGETEDEVFDTMSELLEVNCKIMTIGQYLQPSKNNIPVVDYIKPETFHKFKIFGLKKGFEYVESGPLVRSSYNSQKHL